MPKAIDFDADTGELIYAPDDDFQADDAYHAGYNAGWHGQPADPPKGAKLAARYREGHEFGQTQRLAYDARQKAKVERVAGPDHIPY